MRICTITENDAQWIIDRMQEEPLFSAADLSKAISTAALIQDEIGNDTDERLTAEEMREKCLSIYTK